MCREAAMGEMKRDNGGPAFPSDFTDVALYHELRDKLGPIPALTAAKVNAPGMTLRDWFAGQALVGMNASPALMEVVTGPEAGAGRHNDRLAAAAYSQADAMLRARKEPSNG
jgi:hypothetical protein